MRWLLISSQHHPTHGGIGTYVSRFVSAAVEAGWTIDLITRPGPCHPEGARVHVIDTTDVGPEFADRIETLRYLECIRPYRYALWSCAVAEYLQRISGEFDAIEFVDCQAEGFASFGTSRIRERFSDTPMIVHAHTPMFVEEEINGCDLNRFGRGVYHQWEHRALDAADGIIVTSRLLGQRMPADVTQAVIPYPIAEIPIIDRPPLRNQTILFIGSVQPRKGVDTWVHSLNVVMDSFPNVSAVLIGPDTRTGPNESSMVEHLGSLLDVRHADRLKWLGACDHDQVMSLVASASLVVVPSVFESFSFAAAEALGSGTPVLVSDHVGVREHVSGLPCCPAGDVASWANAQLRILEDPTRALQSARKQRAKLFGTCSPARHLKLREEFIRSLQAALPGRAMPNDSADTLVELKSFLRKVEDSERSIIASSRV